MATQLSYQYQPQGQPPYYPSNQQPQQNYYPNQQPAYFPYQQPFHQQQPLQQGPLTLLITSDTSALIPPKSLTITDPQNKSHPLYTATFHRTFRSPDITVHNATGTLATVTLHSLSSTIDLAFTSPTLGTIKLEKDHWPSSKMRITLGGSTFYWKGSTFGKGDLKLYDERENVVAVYDRAAMSLHKMGELRILVPVGGGEVVDGIVVSCIAMAEKERRGRAADASG
ncbi:hypothetical protein HDV00_012129 [Rhizophlyctis rosea]|nr:hypothetical protein HDV00_012129 [Rhizophlyctis rosea]